MTNDTNSRLAGGCDTRQSSAWAQAMRWIKLRDRKGDA